VTGASPSCDALVGLITSDRTADATAEVDVGFIDDLSEVYLAEDLAAASTPSAASGYLDSVRRAVASCPTLRADLDGSGLSTVRVTEFSTPRLGDGTVGVHLSSPAAGAEVDVLFVAAGRVVLTTQAFGATRSDAEGFTHDAYLKLTTGSAPGYDSGSDGDSGGGTGSGGGGQPA
jgi:hypothetical protein